MPRRPPSPCTWPGCSQLVPGGGACPTHKRKPWTNPDGSNRRSRLPADWHRRRAAALQRDHHRCRLCGAPAVAVDHIVPHTKGGTDELANLQAVCQPCHDAKTKREIAEARWAPERRNQRPPTPHPGLRPPGGGQ